MRYFICTLLLAGMLATAVQGRPVREAPDFFWKDASGKAQNAKSFRGKPLIILITPNARNRRFRAQVAEIQNVYERLAAAGALFFVAFTSEPGRTPSNVPFILATDGPRVGYLYEEPTGPAIAIIGKDGNLDYVTTHILQGQRILDIIDNSFVNQEALRRD